MIDLTADTFDEVVKSEDLILVDFWAEWCAPCKAMLPVLQNLEDDEVTLVGKVNADLEMGLCGRFNVRSIPTMVLFRNGEEVGRLVGAHPSDAVEEFISQTASV